MTRLSKSERDATHRPRKGPVGLAACVAADIAEQAQAIGRRRPCSANEKNQIATIGALSAALGAARDESSGTWDEAAFAPLAELFAAADAAAKRGGLPIPRGLKRYPLPINPAGLCWLGVGQIMCCLTVIAYTRRGDPRRSVQLATLTALERALHDKAHGIADDNGAELPARWRAASDALGAAIPAIVAEATEIALAAPAIGAA